MLAPPLHKAMEGEDIVRTISNNGEKTNKARVAEAARGTFILNLFVDLGCAMFACR